MKLWNYMVIITGMALVLKFIGIDVAGMDTLFSLIGVIFGTNGISGFNGNSNFWSAVFGSSAGILSTAVITSSIVIGLYYARVDKSYLILPFLTGTIIIWISILNSIINMVVSQQSSWIGGIIGIAFIPLSVGFLQSCLDYFMGLN